MNEVDNLNAAIDIQTIIIFKFNSFTCELWRMIGYIPPSHTLSTTTTTEQLLLLAIFSKWFISSMMIDYIT